MFGTLVELQNHKQTAVISMYLIVSINTHVSIYILINCIHFLTNIYQIPLSILLSGINLGIWHISVK